MLSRFLQRFFPQQEQKVVILGLDAAGKTTFLYRLALGEIVTTIPTIGFNVESVQVQTRHGKLVMNCWDLGGCGKIRPLMRHYYAMTTALIWVVDSNDLERMSESISECAHMLRDLDTITPEEGRTIPCLLLANKQDLPNALTAEAVRDRFAPILKDHPHAVFPTSMTSPLSEGGLSSAMDWLKAQLNAQREETKQLASTPVESPGLPNGPPTLAQKLESYVERAQKDSDPEEFLEQFKNVDLPSWDHYTHIRLAYLILMKYGRQKGKNMIFDGIQHYIANSSRTTGRTFHITMTYFWIQMVHFGIRSMPPHDGMDNQPEDEFARFLLLNPYLVDGNLWSDYYSKDVIMTQSAKDAMVLPDKKQLPNIVSRESVRGVTERVDKS